jgi:hypothetical protein
VGRERREVGGGWRRDIRGIQVVKMVHRILMYPFGGVLRYVSDIFGCGLGA